MKHVNLWMREQKPRYPHDCKRCRFIGHYKEFDLYACGPSAPGEAGEVFDKIEVDTVVARRSSDPGDYLSGSCFAFINVERNECDHPLTQAMARVIYTSHEFTIQDRVMREAWRCIVEPMFKKIATESTK